MQRPDCDGEFTSHCMTDSIRIHSDVSRCAVLTALREAPSTTQPRQMTYSSRSSAVRRKNDEVAIGVVSVVIPSVWPMGSGGESSFRDRQILLRDLKSPVSLLATGDEIFATSSGCQDADRPSR